MDEADMPRQLPYGVLSQGQRNPGCPKKWFKDCIKDRLRHAGITPKELETRASVRTGWRTTTGKAVSSFKDNHQSRLVSVRERRKAAALDHPPQWPSCDLHCSRVCVARASDSWATLDPTRHEDCTTMLSSSTMGHHLSSQWNLASPLLLEHLPCHLPWRQIHFLFKQLSYFFISL